ncbi:hypothetical protein [Brevibacillus dissolubilis]|uniref:hypothetical protein n=1 Tax=Brevibacillus dissolubilis TaxID=1844116 RepID=UPI0011174D48|nr:hypothetical protein [Brevibacillus dissolubilis]
MANQTNTFTYVYEVLDKTNDALVRDAAECLGQTFAGVTIGNTRVQEPVVSGLGLTAESFGGFCYEYLKTDGGTGLTIIAKEPDTGRVVGVLACDDFNPKAEPVVFEGDLEQANLITEFVMPLEEKFIESVEHITGKPMTTGEHVHLFMVGVRLEKNKRYVGQEMFKLLEKVAKAKGFKGMFGEITNPKSANLFQNMLGFKPLLDPNGQPIKAVYAEHPVLHTVPADVAVDTTVMYKPLDEQFKLALAV